jgi:hypothetical protein
MLSNAKKDKRTNNDSQNNTHKTNDGATRTLLKIWNALVGVAGTAPDKIVLDLSIQTINEF